MEEKCDRIIEFVTIGEMLLGDVIESKRKGFAPYIIYNTIDLYLDARDGFLAKVAGDDVDLRDLDEDLPDMEGFLSDAKEAWKAGQFELACHMVSEGLKCIGLRADEFWRNDERYLGWRRVRLPGGSYILDDGNEYRYDFIAIADLRRIGILYDEWATVKIDGRYWLRKAYLSEDDFFAVSTYYAVVEYSDDDIREYIGDFSREELEEDLDRLIEENAKHQADEWDWERSSRLLNAENEVRKNVIERLLDDNYIPEKYDLLRRKSSGEKYLMRDRKRSV